MDDTTQRKQGALYALAAFGFWGLVPIYFKAVGSVSPLEVLAHRVIWSVALTAVFLTVSHGWPEVRVCLAKPKVWLTLMLTATLATTNWFLFIYAITTDRVLQASLGYYLNPLLNVLLGMIFLGERLNRRQTAAVVLAGVGTASLTMTVGVLPWISLSLALLFGTYGLLRKTVDVGPLAGLFVETSITGPLALAYLAWLGMEGKLAFVHDGWWVSVLLVTAGAVTTLPLLWFTAAAKRLPLSILGLFQYLAPTLSFLLGVFAYGEPFTKAHLFTFVCIWTGLAIFAADSWMRSRPLNRHRHPA